MRAVLADTGPLYALVDTDDALHERARNELTVLKSEKRRVIVATPVLMECYSLVLYRLGITTAQGWLAEIDPGTGQLTPLTDDVQAAGDLVRRYPDQDITLFDALLSVLATRLHVPVWTFDHHFDVMQTTVWR